MLIGARRALLSPSNIALSGCVLRLEADDLSTLFQNNGGTTAVAADADVVGYWGDKSGNGFHLTSTANDGTRPTWRLNSGLPYVDFDGTDDLLRRTASLGLYTSINGCAVFVACRPNPTTNRTLWGEGNSSDADPIYEVFSNASTASTRETFIRNDVPTILATTGALTVTNAFDNTDKVIGWTDTPTGSLTAYINNSAGATGSYTKGSALTLDRFTLGALVRNTIAGWFAMRVYALVAFRHVPSADQRSQLVTYLRSKMGL